MADVAMGSASSLIAQVVNFFLYKLKHPISYVFLQEKKVKKLEKKVERLKEKRDRVQHDVDAAERNGEKIHTDVKSWMIKADDIINVELKEVKDLEDEAKHKCFIGLCPNFKSRYQLSKKADKDANIVDELLQQDGLDKVSYRDVPQPIAVASPAGFEAFDSRKQVFHEILEALKDPSINIIGVYGMGGVGKTTLVKEVYRQVKEDKLFDSVVFAAVTHTPDIQKIQEQIADILGLKFEELSMTGRASRLCERLKKEKKILVVLDDIWARLDLMQVGIPFGDEHMGCTVLLTSRDLYVLSNGMAAQKIFPIGVLRQEEAWDLFKKTAGNSVESPDLRPIATEVAKKCAGLPIAISTVASNLRNKGLFAWRDALRQLNKPSSSNFRGVPANAYSAIELSYNNLESEELKQTFLLCSLLGHNAFIRDLLKYAMGLGLFQGVRTVEETRDRLLTVVSDLKASCLLLDSYNDMFFDMHDLISDVAISIASKDNRLFALRHNDVLNDLSDIGETVKGYEKINLLSASISKLPDQLKCPKLSFFRMQSKDPSMKMPTSLFKETESLKVLDLTEMHLSSLPSSICQLTNLRTLCLDHCVLGDIAIIGELKNLEVLSLWRSDIERLPKEIGQLIKLKMLDISHCSRLKIIPPNVLSSLSRLEELCMGNSFSQWEVEEHLSQRSNASLAELKSLSCLTALDVNLPNAKIIPKDLFFEKLQRYSIFIGKGWDWEYEIEYSRTLKLKLHTSIARLGHGMKMLLMKAENVYIDEMEGLEILWHKSEDGEWFQQLKNLCIQNGGLIQYIIKDNDVGKIEFLQLQSLTLHCLPRLVSFSSQNNSSTSISLQVLGLPLFNEKMVFPKLENLKLSSISIERIWQYQLPRGSSSFQNLSSIVIEGCSNLKHVFSYSMADCLQQLECLEITDCKSMQEIICMEGIIKEEYVSRAAISFPRLNSLKLKGLQKLVGFCHGDCIVEFQSLKTLEIEHCSELEGFIINKSVGKYISTGCIDEVLFDEKVVAFPNLEKMTISHLRNVKRIWYTKLHGDSFCKLKQLKVEYCDKLLNIFSLFLLGAFQRLEMVTINDCGSLEEVFDLHGLDLKVASVMTIQLRELYIYSLPKLKHVWNKDPYGKFSFQNLRVVNVWECWSLKSLFPYSIAIGLLHLESLMIQSCKLEEIVSKNIEGSQKEIWFEFNCLSFLRLWILPNLKCFYPGVHTTVWPLLKRLWTYGCEKIKIFGQPGSQIQQPLFLIEKIIPQLEEVFFSSDDIAMICDGQFAADFFGHIKVVGISCHLNESAIFLFCFLQRFYNLEMLHLVDCNFKELSLYEGDVGEGKDMMWRLPKIKKLKLNRVCNMTHLWKQDSLVDHICASLEALEVCCCDSLINLASAFSSFQNLTTLNVWNCKGMVELITSSKAQSLVCLVTMRIRKCGMMTEIVASEGDEAIYEIIFRKLKCLELDCLKSLQSFCLGNYSFKFPSLEQVIVSQCPRLKSFCQGALYTPKLERVEYLKDEDYEGCWAGDLNATIEELHEKKVGYHCLKQLKFLEFPELKDIWNRNPQEMLDFKNLEFLEVGYHGLKQLKFSEFPELMDIWNRNPQEMLGFKNLEFLEVCDSDNLRCVFSISMALSLRRLQRMEIKRCNKMEQVIKEEEGATTDNKIIIIFPLLKSIFIESCPDLTCFYLGSVALECPSLKEINVAYCPNMTSFISALSTQKDKEAIIGDGIERNKDDVDTPPAFFLEKIVFSKLENLKLISINLERIWQYQLPKGSYSTQNLTSFIIEGCGNLKYVLSYSLVECLQQLKCLEITECKSMLEIMSTEEVIKEEYGKRVVVSFPRLKSLKLRGLQKLIGFCHEDYFVKFQSLSTLEIEDCPELKRFIFGKSMGEAVSTSNIDEALFNENVAFPNLEKMTISRLGNFKRIWYNQLHGDSFCKLKELKVEYCDELLNIFSSFLPGVFQRLEMVTVTDCGLLEELFDLHGFDINKAVVVVTLLKELYIYRLPKLKHVWNKDPSGKFSFQNLLVVKVGECWSLKSLIPFSIAKRLLHLETLDVYKCGVEEIVSKNIEGLEQEFRFEFNHLSFLSIWILPHLKCFYPGVHTIAWPVLKKFKTHQCRKIKIFGQRESRIDQPLFLIEKIIPQLEEVFFSSDDIAKICDGQLREDFFGHIKVLGISFYRNVSAPFSLCFLKRFFNLEMLQLVDCNFKELSFSEVDVGEEKDMIWTLPKIKKLTLNRVSKITHLWKQGSLLDHVCANLETLEVWDCDSLINLASASSFQNLTTLDVRRCNWMAELIASSKAQSLVHLVTMRVSECEMMTEIVASEGDEATCEIIFKELKYLELRCLKSLKSFCSGNYTFKFPSLEEVIVSQCPRLKSFCQTQGALYTPKPERVYLKDEDYEGCLAGDLNATIEELYENKVGYHGLKQLKFSEFPELMDIWNRNPQELLDFKNLEFLEVSDSNNLRCIFSISMALSLRQLQRMEIKRCNKMKKVIKEEEEATTDDKIITIFPLLKSISIESCPDLTNFYLGSSALECPSLKEIKVAFCSNMTTFDSALSTEKDKEAIIGYGIERHKDNPDTPPAFFSDKVVLPMLKKLHMRDLGNLKKIWHDQVAADSFCKLEDLLVERCHKLLHLFPFNMSEKLHRLKDLEILECDSVEEVFEPQRMNVEESYVMATIPPNAVQVQVTTRFVFPGVGYLKLYMLPNLKSFFHKMHTTEWPSLRKMLVYGCDKVEIFASEYRNFQNTVGQSQLEIQIKRPLLLVDKVAFPCLEELRLEWNGMMKEMWHGRFLGEFFCCLKVLELKRFPREATALLYGFIQSLPNLEKLVVSDASFCHIFQCQELGGEENHALKLACLSKLRLSNLPELTDIWDEDFQTRQAFYELRILEVQKCSKLKILVPSSVSFQNLTRLVISKCNGLINLLTHSTAKSLVQLTTMRIMDCRKVEEIIACTTNEVKDGIIFSQLKYLRLSCLPNLANFCFGNCTIDFPSLEDLVVKRCPKMMIFSGGELSTPKLQGVKFTKGDDKRHWKGNLNATIKQYFQEINGML